MTEQTPASDPGLFDVELVLKQARTYLAFGDQVRLFTERLSAKAEAGTHWGEALQQHFAELKATIAQSAETPTINPELARLWLLIVEAWSEAASALGITTETVPQGLAQPEVWQAYQRTQLDYFNRLRETAIEALDLMEVRLREQATDGKTINGLRELYNLWVDCNEETYGRMLRSTAYGELSGRLFNTLLHCYARPETKP